MDALIALLEEIQPDVDYRTHQALIDDGVLDSFDIISLISEIDAELDVTIPAEEIIPENFNSAKALQALIDRLSAE